MDYVDYIQKENVSKMGTYRFQWISDYIQKDMLLMSTNKLGTGFNEINFDWKSCQMSTAIFRYKTKKVKTACFHEIEYITKQLA